MITAVVLAAGEGRRMGAPKVSARLPDGRTFLQAVLATVRAAGVDEVRVVVGPGTQASADDATLVLNPRPEAGMLSSVRAGVRAAPAGTRALLLWPVDHPHVRAATVRRLIEAHAHTGAPVVVPVHGGRRGHPTLFDAALLPELLEAPDDVGARAVVHAHEQELCELAVEDAGVIADLDTPADLETAS